MDVHLRIQPNEPLELVVSQCMIFCEKVKSYNEVSGRLSDNNTQSTSQCLLSIG